MSHNGVCLLDVACGPAADSREEQERVEWADWAAGCTAQWQGEGGAASAGSSGQLQVGDPGLPTSHLLSSLSCSSGSASGSSSTSGSGGGSVTRQEVVDSFKSETQVCQPLTCWAHCCVEWLVTYVLKGKVSPYSITKPRVPVLILVLSSQPAGDVNHKPNRRLPLLSARSTVSYHHDSGQLSLASLRGHLIEYQLWLR